MRFSYGRVESSQSFVNFLSVESASRKIGSSFISYQLESSNYPYYLFKVILSVADQNIHEFGTMDIAALSAFQEKCFKENEITMRRTEFVHISLYLILEINDRLSITLKFITIKFILYILYASIRKFGEFIRFPLLEMAALSVVNI